MADVQADPSLCYAHILVCFVTVRLIKRLNEFSLVVRKPEHPTRSDTNQAVQLQKMARGLKFRIYSVEGSYYLCNENKGADQLRGYREDESASLFSHMQNVGFLMTRLKLFSPLHAIVLSLNTYFSSPEPKVYTCRRAYSILMVRRPSVVVRRRRPS